MATPLDVGQSRTVTISAQPKWNDTGVQLRPGRYRFEARGTWSDWFVRCGPEGFHSLLFLLFEQQRRVPRASWFALVGSVGHDEAKAFVIGRGAEVTIEREGELSCFANDVDAMYWNNAGAVELTVTCLSLKKAEAQPAAVEKAPPAAEAKPAPAPKPTKTPKPAAPKKAPVKKADTATKTEAAKKEAPAKKAAPVKAAKPAAPKPKAPAKKKEPSGSDAAPGKATAAPRAKPRKPRAP